MPLPHRAYGPSLVAYRVPFITIRIWHQNEKRAQLTGAKLGPRLTFVNDPGALSAKYSPAQGDTMVRWASTFWRLLGSGKGSGGANFCKSFMKSFLQFRFALLQFRRTPQPLLCKNVQGFGRTLFGIERMSCFGSSSHCLHMGSPRGRAGASALSVIDGSRDRAMITLT